MRTPPPLPRVLVARVLRLVRISLRAGHPAKAIAAIRNNLCGESVDLENVEHVPLAVAVNDVKLVNLLEDAGITSVGDVLRTSNEAIQVRCRKMGATSVAKVRRAVELYVERMKGDGKSDVEIETSAKGRRCTSHGTEQRQRTRSV